MTNGDATASFSGYLYQADIALLLSLKRIESIITDGGIGNIGLELSNWNLEVEGDEDITISKYERSMCIQKHAYQIKDTSGKNPSDYTVAVLKLHDNDEISSTKVSYLVTSFDLTSKIISANNNLEFLNGLYNGTNLTSDKYKLKSLYGRSILQNKITKNGTGSSTVYNFNTGETLASIKNHVENGTSDFLAHRFNYKYFGSWDSIHNEIEECIKRIKPEISQSINYRRYFESIIKHYIQNNKSVEIHSRNKLNLNDLYEKIKSSDLLDLNQSDYQNIVDNIFIKLFREEFDKYYTGGIQSRNVDIRAIITELGEAEYNSFLNDTIMIINDCIFNNTDNKIYGLIRYTICKKKLDELYEYGRLSFPTILEIIAFFGDSIIQKISIIIKHFYAKKHNSNLKDSYFIGTDDCLYLSQGDYHGILTGLPINNTGRCIEFLESEIYYQYEQTHLGINNINENIAIDKYIGNLGKTGDEDFFNNNSIIKEMHENKFRDITKTKNLIIFGGNNCLSSNAHKFMS